MSKSKLSSRITWRVILIMIIFNALIIGGVFVFDLGVSLLQSRLRSQHLIDGICGKLVTMLETVEFAARNNVAEIEANLDSPEKVYDALEHEFRLNVHYNGCGVAFEPDYFPSQGRWFEPYVTFQNEPGSEEVRDDSDRIIRKQVGSADHNYLASDWYKTAIGLEKGKGILTNPYYDDVGTKRVLASYVSPVTDSQGRKVGVFGIDLDLSWIANTIINDELTIRNVEFLDSHINSDEKDNYIFIQILDSNGMKIAGSASFDQETLQTIMKRDSIGFENMKINGQTYGVSSKRIPNTDWTLVVAQHERFILLYGYFLGAIISLFMIIGTIFVFFFMGNSIRRAVEPLRFLSDSAKEVAQGHFDTPLPTFKHQDEIAQLRDSFDTMQESLKRYVEELKESTAAKASLESELNVAHRIQMSMIPRRFPKREGLDLYAEMIPAKAVGGDLYSYYLKNDLLYICVGDVSGKGVPASLFMAQTTRLFYTFAKEGFKPADMAVRMNDELSENNDQCMFVTMFIGLVDLSSGRLDYCSCGHNAPIIDNAFLEVTNKNKPLGLMPGIPFKGESIDDIRGRQMLIYTDGLSEAENRAKELFGDERMLQLTGSVAGRSAREVISLFTEAVNQFREGAEPNDDLTLMCLSIS